MAQFRPPTPIALGRRAERAAERLTADTERRGRRLPAPITRFIGREREIAESKRLLAETRLLTLTGPGGSGKTRLGLAIATDIAATTPDGVCLVEFAELTDASLVPRTVATALGVREEPHRPLIATLADALAAQPPLLLLDNCEHLIAPIAALADALLQSSSGLRILATSREALRVPGEVTWRVPSLSLPDDRETPSAARLMTSEAVQLFTDRVRLRQPSFTVTDEHAATIATICRRLDGMPLALELAAARVSVLTLPQIAGRLNDALHLLTHGGRTVAPRHQALRATLDWSYALLTEDEQAVLRRLAVFAGGCDLAAAEAVCAGDGIAPENIVPLLAQLVDKSLLVMEEAQGAARYRLQEAVRQYAREQLTASDETAPVRQRHAIRYLTLVEDAAPALVGPEQGVWIGQLEGEHDNLRLALHWFLERADAEQGLRLAQGLWRFWEARSYLGEGSNWLTTFLARYRARGGPSPPPMHWLDALFGAGRIAFLHGEYTAARPLLEELLAAARAAGNDEYLAFALNHLGHLACFQHDLPAAHALYAEGLALRRAMGNPYHIAISLGSLGQIALIEGDYAYARDALEESLALYRQAGVMIHMTATLRWLGLLAIEQHDLHGARAHFTESLRRGQESHAQWRIAEGLEGFAMIAALEGAYPRAMRLLGAAAGAHIATGEPPFNLWHERVEHFLATARAALGETASAEIFADGAAMTIDAAIADALATVPGGPPTDAAHRAANGRHGVLSRREWQVVALVAAGKLNREIADTLFITEKTVEWHISNSLRKLGFRTRADLAVWAVTADPATALPPHDT